ncbi:MAG TPA: 2Fe-2S iron-sulfur cluster-binding protein [Steroidobacteraceae bacterium]|nr:2Fe-2S iron-sulfur cluster-binding protein [Steroidobacteraceae bacterium]
MSGPTRIGGGLLIDPGRPVGFSFDDRPLRGLHGDTLASALLASGERVVGRSFKYHRRRGILTCAAHEPCALVDLIGPHGREPNLPATTVPLCEGLRAQSQNRWPSLEFDALEVNDWLSRFLPAGFYYKTFMSPGWAWERLYEPLIRRAAGLGRLEAAVGDHAAPAQTVHAHTDVLVIGAGAAGLSAGAALAQAGLRVLLLEQDVVAGGGSLLDERWGPWREARLREIQSQARLLTRTAVLGAYGHGVFGALETLSPQDSARQGGLRERLHVVRARRVLIACGATERLIAFPGNDVPGVMLSGAALEYLRRYGVAAGSRPLLFTNNDEAYETVFALQAAGLPAAGVVDVRERGPAAERAHALGIEVHARAVVSEVRGRQAVEAVAIRGRDDSRTRALAADCLLMSGGWTPHAALGTQLGGESRWHEELGAFTVTTPAHAGCSAGAANGRSGLAACAADGWRAAVQLAAQFAASVPAEAPETPPDAGRAPLEPFWEVRGRGKAFVDLQNDVTAEDVRLAHREGYEHVEHMKRYTTHGMATDQGRTGGLVGSAILAEARGVPLAQVGVSKPRPYSQPVPFAALAGGEVREHYKPRRRLPLHEWHESAGATFVNTGLWLRPLVYSRETGWAPVLEEARAVRSQAGITDVSTLGKLDVQGPDAAAFLDFVYANTFSTLAIGRARYGIMLREDGMMFDDGTTARLGPDHYLVTTTTANATAVLEHLEFQLQANCPQMQVVLSDVTDQWAQFAIAGPRAREVLAGALPGHDLSNEAFPFMAAAAIVLEDIPGRLFRISFSGELAFELAVPASHAVLAWEALLRAGEPHGLRPYGLDALNTLRIEKGHVTSAELNGNTTADDLGFGRMLKKQGDFVGRHLLQRPGLTAADRLQLVGVRPADPAQRLRNGLQLLSPGAGEASLGYVTSSTPSVELEGWVGLALLAGGRQRTGSRLLAASPIHGERFEVQIVSPHMLDPENSRVRA